MTGIQAVKVAVCYSFIESALLTGLSSYALVSRMMKNKAAQVLALLLLLFSTGYEEVVPMTYIWHMYLVPMSYDIAQALGLIVVTLLLVQLENEKTDVRNLVWSLCCLLCGNQERGGSRGTLRLCGCISLFVSFTKQQEDGVYRHGGYAGCIWSSGSIPLADCEKL